MLYVCRRDGTVRSYDLRSEEGLANWTTDSRDPTWQRGISGVSLGEAGHRADLPLPRRFRAVSYSADVVEAGDHPVAERVVAVCDDVVVSLTMYLNGRSGRFRVDADRRGTRRFIP